jgi:hypothetical protein
MRSFYSKGSEVENAALAELAEKAEEREGFSVVG